ncbi:hypothetical protein QLL95_gp0646 [Cotonvirus japonicus]|uniref:Ankyrin repeat protein n=1 Tax=Cotonvirus japonicus TaxID=2811091 RepID=A0ABM7NTS7_9VIRU|nr:hypothetical protein QLL95_gp0646 [Cotonvirus japonicus]BCS83477.1 hypothetical protein [Cotonvirus japonicus]
MEHVKHILCLLNDYDYDGIESLTNLKIYKSELKLEYQLNYLNLISDKTNKFFFKLYIHNKNKWEFFDYGTLCDTYFYARKSKLLLFNIANIEFKIMRRNDSLNHIMINENEDICYLLYNPYPEVIDLLLKIYQ